MGSRHHLNGDWTGGPTDLLDNPVLRGGPAQFRQQLSTQQRVARLPAANTRSECTHFGCTKRYTFVHLSGCTKRYTFVHPKVCTKWYPKNAQNGAPKLTL